MTILYIILFISLAVVSYTDIRTRRIPNTILLLMASAWLLVNIMLKTSPVSLLKSVFACLFLLIALIFLVKILNRINPRLDMGGGDIKLIGILGLYLGFWDTLYSVLFACFIMLVLMAGFRKHLKNRIFPFAPAISLGVSIYFCLNVLFL